jgi:hypothetical protein
MREFDKISLADHPVVVDFNTLDGFLLKPMQRLVKYPLLLKVLITKLYRFHLERGLPFCRIYAIRPVPTRRRRRI